MASFMKSGVDAKIRSEEDLVALSADNLSLREQAISLMLEIESLRERLEARTAGFQLLRYRAGGARK